MKKLRRFAWIVYLFALLIVFYGCGKDEDESGSSGVGLHGNIEGTLSAAGGPYMVDGDILVPEGKSLTILPGTQILFNGNYKFQVEGLLNAVGEEDNLILFTSNRYPLNKGDWKGIWLVGADNASVLKYIQVSYANRYNLIDDTTRAYTPDGFSYIDTVLHRGAVTIRDCSPLVERCIVDYAGYDAIHIVGDASPLINYNTIVLNAFNGIRIEPDWTVGSEAYSADGPRIQNNIIVENDDAGIRAPNGYELVFAQYPDTLIRNNNIWNNQSPDYLPISMQEYVFYDVHLDPQFNDLEEGDYHLHPCSGSVDTGHPDDPKDPDGTVADVGVYPLFQAVNHLAHTLIGDQLHLTTDFEHYLVKCDVLIEEGDQLIIDPGVKIYFVENFGFTIRGEIQAVGTASQPIIFTSYLDGEIRTERARGDWKNIILDGASGNSRMEHVIIEYASVDNIAIPQSYGALSVESTSPSLSHITIRESYHSGLLCNNGSSPEIDFLTVENAGVYGVSCKLNSNPVITRAEIFGIQGYGVSVETNSSPTLRNILIHDVNVSGIELFQICNPIIHNVTVHGPQHHALRMENSCNPDILNCIFASYGAYGIEAMVTSFPTVDYIGFYSPAGEGMVNPDSILPINIVNADPDFVDTENEIVADRDFHLVSGSPCEGAGSDETDLGAYGGTLDW